MKFLFDLLPVLLFFVTFKVAGSFPVQAQALATVVLLPFTEAPPAADQSPILLATLVAIVATVLQVSWLLAKRRTVEPMVWIGLVVIVVFGGATLWLQDETFIKWKPTILYWAFACTLAVATLFARRNLIRSLLGNTLQLPDRVWAHLNWAWMAFFSFAGALNLWVAFTVPTATWVNFKLFGLMSLTLVFALTIGVWVSRHATEVPSGK